ncbi:hypothetical protein [Pseudomonas sp. FEN]|nr:hypothetical protein [Pseudomonas sp. FEN]
MPRGEWSIFAQVLFCVAWTDAFAAVRRSDKLRAHKICVAS